MKTKKIKAAARREFYRHTKAMGIFHSVIPVSELDRILRANGMKLVQEDGTDFEGFFCGEHSRATIDIAFEDGTECESVLVLEWCKMESGRYEINTYLS